MVGVSTVCFLDSAKLQSDFLAAAHGYINPEQPLYTAYFGISEQSGLPAWFIANGNMSLTGIKPDLNTLVLYSTKVPSVKFTGVIFNSDHAGMYKQDVSYHNVKGKINGNDCLSGMINLYKDIFASTLSVKTPEIYSHENPATILLPTSGAGFPAIG
ncbi:MAG TPA: hypothetical protein VGF14_05605 [Alphaproteobacteria bacterium]